MVLKVFIEPFNFSFFSITGWGIDLDYCDIEWFALEMNRDHSALSNSVKQWAMPCGDPQGGQVVVERSDRMWSTGEGNGKPRQYSCLENPMNSVKRQKDRTLKDELPQSVGAWYTTGDQRRNNPRKNEELETKQKPHTVVDVTGDRSKIRCCKE